MQVEYGDLWTFECDVRCVTTNGTVQGGKNVMGAGCAREAAERYPWMPSFYAQQIEKFGNHTFLTGPLVMFPVKHRVWEKADIDLIERSANELASLAFLYGWTNVALPTPGCGLGGLAWEDVEPVIAPILGHMATIVRFPSERPEEEESACTCGDLLLVDEASGRVTARHLPECPLAYAPQSLRVGEPVRRA